MTIKNVGNSYGPTRPNGSGSVQGTGAAKPAAPATGGSAAPAAAPARSDSISISDAGRALAAGGPEGAAGATSSLSSERIADLRRKVLEGAYNSTHAVDQVAKRILASGDL